MYGRCDIDDRKGTSISLSIRPDMKEFHVAEGGSVCVDGVCLTVEGFAGQALRFSAVLETLQRSTLKSVSPGRRVNLERSLRLGDRLDGHMVLGHVDGAGEIIKDREVGGSLLRTIRVPSGLSMFMAEKGSVAVDGISLTIAQVSGNEITISFIPATMQRTTMAGKSRGDQVNLECDVLARYLFRMVESGGQPGSSLLTKMEGLGF